MNFTYISFRFSAILFTFLFSVSLSAQFITTWKTTSDGDNITIPTKSGETYNYTVDWGDGSAPTTHTGDATHTYATAATYSVSITGTFPRIFFSSTNGDRHKILDITQWGTNAWTSMEAAFSGCTKLTSTTATDTPNLTNVTSMNSMFYDAYSFNADISDWDVSNVTNMGLMFVGAYSFDQDLSGWDVRKVTDMTGMFDGVTLSTAHYDELLDSWGKQDVQNNVSFDGGNSKYCALGETGRNTLITTKGWTITDGDKDTAANCGTLNLSEPSAMPWAIVPNPTAAVLHISGSTPVRRVQVFSIDGKKQLEQAGAQHISLEHLDQGVYLVKLEGAKEAHTFKVIKL